MKSIVSLILFLAIGLAAALFAGFRPDLYSAPAPHDDEQQGLADRIIIKFSISVAENTPKGLAALKFAQLAKEKTDGRVEVQTFPNGTLYSDTEEIQAMMKGDLQMIAPAFSYLSNILPAWYAMDLPFALPNREAVEEAFNGEIGKLLFRTLESRDMKGMAFWSNGFKQITGPRELIRPEDFNGLRIRIIPSRVLEAEYQLLGAKTTPLNFNEVYRNLESGGVNGQENTFSNIYTKRLYQVQSHMTISNHGYLGYAVIINRPFWNKLPADIQEKLAEAMDETTRWMTANSDAMNAAQLEQMKAISNMQIHELTSEERREWIRVLEPVYERFRKEIGGDLTDRMLELRDKYIGKTD
ncbi:DctP family TRAP transporter solute-binding subunit [Paenibacillus aurantius]|uniref:DctP family TRAP transporter solute-binding subunit n=1 Tax=Paenibacillus aurantius TaxID=2918900 RepID=A0AA96LD57_9BACL|nr:DctP family TRAP transporter solute-binding subunit [Paenibacillus aurantius]WNQ10878.1 DctP family TRAP transporter solute-binding subunit [Paenibacillus aurantius]